MTTENIQAACVELVNRLLNSEQFGYAVTAEVRDAARKALGRAPVEQAQYQPAAEAKPVAPTVALIEALKEAQHYLHFHEDASAPHMQRIAAALAAAPQQPGPTWGDARTVGNMIAQLQTIDPTMPLHASFTIEIDGKRRTKIKGLTASREFVNGQFIESGKPPNAIVLWTKPDERPVPQQPAPADKDAIRDAALEEAAKICDLVWKVDFAAKAIRNLKSQPAPAVGADAVNAKRYLFLRGHSQKWSNDGGAIHFSFAVSRQKPNQWVIDTKSGDEMDFAIDAAIALQAGEQS